MTTLTTLNDHTVRLAKAANLATIVTLMPDGQPQAQLRWIDTDGESLFVNTEPQRRAAKNIACDPRITVHIHSCENVYDWAEVRGTVMETVGGEEARAHLDFLSRKYTGTDYQMPIGPEGRIILCIAPRKVLTPAIGSF